MDHPTAFLVWRVWSCCRQLLYYREPSYISHLLLLLLSYHRALTVNSLIHWWSLVLPLSPHCFCTDYISEVNLDLWWLALPWYKPPTQTPHVPCHFTFIFPVLWTLKQIQRFYRLLYLEKPLNYLFHLCINIHKEQENKKKWKGKKNQNNSIKRSDVIAAWLSVNIKNYCLESV